MGDMVGPDATTEEAERFIKLVGALQEIAPVFVSNGNHEQEYIEATGDDLFGRIAALGVTVVDDSFVDVELAGNTLRIGGMLDYLCGHTHGGLIRIPFVGGLYAPPWEEWWPTYDMDYYELENDTKMVITSGLSGYW